MGELADGATLVLSVADSLEATYAIPLMEYPGNPPTVVSWAVGASRSPLRAEVEQAIVNLDISVSIEPILPGTFPTQLLANRSGNPRHRDAVANGSHAVVIRSLGIPGVPARHHALGLSLATDVARYFDAPIFDPVVSDLRSAQEATAVLDRFELERCVADWVNVVIAADGSMLWIITNGLTRFGLPELQTHRVPAELARDWVPVSYAIADSLLDRFAAQLGERAPFIELDATFDIAGLPIRLTPDIATSPDGTSFLTVTPEHDRPDFFFKLAAAVR